MIAAIGSGKASVARTLGEGVWLKWKGDKCFGADAPIGVNARRTNTDPQPDPRQKGVAHKARALVEARGVRTFRLEREEYASGISGAGRVSSSHLRASVNRAYGLRDGRPSQR